MSGARPDPSAAAASALQQIALGIVGSRGGDLSFGTMKRGLREAVKRDPIDAILVTVLGGAYLFHLAEKDVNPKCRSYWDALVFIATSMSVGYDDVFARTEAGKVIASFIMTFGPALATAALDPAAGEEQVVVTSTPEALEVQRAILERLDAILASLRGAPAGAADPEGAQPHSP
jgi:hypothetical protein